MGLDCGSLISNKKGSEINKASKNKTDAALYD
jgi:hypothetical protein